MASVLTFVSHQHLGLWVIPKDGKTLSLWALTSLSLSEQWKFYPKACFTFGIEERFWAESQEAQALSLALCLEQWNETSLSPQFPHLLNENYIPKLFSYKIYVLVKVVGTKGIHWKTELKSKKKSHNQALERRRPSKGQGSEEQEVTAPTLHDASMKMHVVPMSDHLRFSFSEPSIWLSDTRF